MRRTPLPQPAMRRRSCERVDAARRSRRWPTGFTLIELMIVIGIVGLLLALLTPAVQYARESSRRTHCLANLRQLGAALHVYHDAMGRLPPAATWGRPGEPLGQGIAPPGTIDRISLGVTNDPDRMHANWLISVLPFIEEEPLYKTFDLRLPIADAHHRLPRATEIAILKCPSDVASVADNSFQRAPDAMSDQLYARGNYAMNGGSNYGCLMRLSNVWPPGSCDDGFQVNGTSLEKDTSQVWGSGIGGLNKSFRFSEFPAGLSKTVAIEEIRAGRHALDRRGAWALGFPGCSVTVAHGMKGNGGPNAGADTIQGCGELKTLAAIVDPPCHAGSPLEISEQATSRSMHPGGVHLLMADGSAGFASDDIDPRLWHETHKRDSRSATGPPF